MQSTGIKSRQQFTKQERINILEELSMSSMSISRFAEAKGIHPVTIHQWKRKMSSNQNKPESNEDIKEAKQEIERLNLENENLKKALADMAIDNQIYKAHTQVLKKKYKEQQLSKKRKK